MFLGSKDYQLMAGPNIQVRYDRAFFSFLDSLGYDVIRSGGWRAGPAIGFRPGRRENGNSIFKITGDDSGALRGLGKIEDTDEARSEEHTSELQTLMRSSYAVFCLIKKNTNQKDTKHKNI